jgi:hypothetical protein
MKRDDRKWNDKQAEPEAELRNAPISFFVLGMLLVE